MSQNVFAPVCPECGEYHVRMQSYIAQNEPHLYLLSYHCFACGHKFKRLVTTTEGDSKFVDLDEEEKKDPMLGETYEFDEHCQTCGKLLVNCKC